MFLEHIKAKKLMAGHTARLKGLAADERRLYWEGEVQRDLSRAARAVLRQMKDELGVRPLAAQLDISPSYVMKLTMDESEAPADPSVAQLDRFAERCPERFGFVRPVLEAAPAFIQHKRTLGAEREALGRRSGRTGPAVRAAFEEWQIAFGGRRRESRSISLEMTREFRQLGATSLVRWHGDAISGLVDPGDALFLRPLNEMPPSEGTLAIVRDHHGLHSVREWDDHQDAWRVPVRQGYADRAEFFTPPARDVEVVGEIVGVLKARRL